MLTKEDVKVIKGLLAEQKDGIIEEVKDIVDYRIGQSEISMEAKFDKRFDAVDQRFDSMDQRFDSMDQRFDEIDEKLEKMDQAISDLAETDQFILGHLDNHRTRITRLEIKTGLETT